MALTRQKIIDLYRRRARRYDLSANLYYVIGFREYAYRKEAVAALALKPGDTVVELGCGTGLNFPYLHAAVGPEGRIIGVDMTDGMINEARARVHRQGWTNVELVLSEAAVFEYPPRVDGVLSTFALTLFPEYDEVIRRGGSALSAEGRFVVLDFKRPAKAPRWSVRLMLAITRPFGVTLDLAERHPWVSMQRCFQEFTMHERFFGFVYLVTGRRYGKT